MTDYFSTADGYSVLELCGLGLPSSRGLHTKLRAVDPQKSARFLPAKRRSEACKHSTVVAPLLSHFLPHLITRPSYTTSNSRHTRTYPPHHQQDPHPPKLPCINPSIVLQNFLIRAPTPIASHSFIRHPSTRRGEYQAPPAFPHPPSRVAQRSPAKPAKHKPPIFAVPSRSRPVEDPHWGLPDLGMRSMRRSATGCGGRIQIPPLLFTPTTPFHTVSKAIRKQQNIGKRKPKKP